MKTVLVSVALVVVGFVLVRFVLRLAIGFVRWARAHRGQASEWAVFEYLQSSLGEWVDGVASSPPWFPFEGTGHHHHHADGTTGGDSSHHGSCDGGHGGGMCQ